jgi:hypothetical protein
MPESPNPVPATIRALRKNSSFAPGSSGFSELIQTYLPLVHGLASRLLPETPDAIPSLVSAVFESFAFRWPRLSKKTVLATWFFRSTWFAVCRERKRLKLPRPVKGSALLSEFRAVQKITKLKKKYLDTALLSLVYTTPAEFSLPLSLSESKAAKRQARALQHIAKILRKTKIQLDPLSFLHSLLVPAPEELKQTILSSANNWTPKQTRSPLAIGIIRSWRWALLRRIAIRATRAVGTALVILILLGSSFAWLANHGYLFDFFIRANRTQIAKDFPELAKPAAPWPATPEDQARVPAIPPKTQADLYISTNIWLAKLTFTADEWKNIHPSQVERVPMFQNGGLVLRNPNAKRNGLSGVIGIDFNWAKGDLKFAGQNLPDVAVRYRGNGTYLNSLYGSKQSFKVDLNKYTKKQKFAGVKDLNFLNCIADNTYLYDSLAEQLFRDLGVPAPRTTYAYVTLHAPGAFTNQPMGLYAMVENVDADFAEERFGSKQTPIFKPVTPQLFFDLGDDWKAYEGIYDLKTKATPAELIRLIEFVRLVSHADDTEFASRLPDFLDLEEFAGFLAGHVLISSYDGFLANGQNYFVYLDQRSNKFGFIPWDQDHAWGEFKYIGTADKREQASIWHPAAYPFHFLKRVMKVEAFKTVYRKKIEFALDNLFTTERLFAQIDHLAAAIRPAVAAENTFRLKRFDTALSTEFLPGPRDGGDNEGPRSRVHQIKEFIPNRIKSIREQLHDESKGARLARARD